jgi:hypothetical protein
MSYIKLVYNGGDIQSYLYKNKMPILYLHKSSKLLMDVRPLCFASVHWPTQYILCDNFEVSFSLDEVKNTSKYIRN